MVFWSTGFIGAKLGLPYAEPLTFLGVRFLLAAVMMIVVALAARAPWPATWAEVRHNAVAGILMHAVCLGGMFSAMHQGVDAGVSALIGGLQPLLVAAAAAPVLGERVRPLQWAGLALGLVGVALVVRDKFGLGSGTELGYGLAVVGLLGITAGALYQKKFAGVSDWRSANVVQFAAAAAVLLPLAWALESMHIDWTPQFIFALGWLCIVLSLGAISLLYLLIRSGASANVASLFYLVPPVTAVMAYFLFGETLSWISLTGMAITVVAVALVNWRR